MPDTEAPDAREHGKPKRELSLLAIARAIADSRIFADAATPARALVKILAGREMGFGPISSVRGIVTDGKGLGFTAWLCAAAIRRSDIYDYRVTERTNEAATVEITNPEGDIVIGSSRFTMEDARKAGLAGGDNWRHYPANMLTARALTNAARLYCPELFAGTPYTPEELGIQTDPDREPMFTPDELEALAATGAIEAGEAPPERRPPPAANYGAAPTPQGPSPKPAPAPAPPPPPASVDYTALETLIREHSIPAATQKAWCDWGHVERLDQLTQDQVDAIVAKSKRILGNTANKPQEEPKHAG